ncbi:phosphoribosylanthranilate isomerase [Maribacter sp. 2307ULW6-5]|uniref:phosphoribosylanthranilate isomerase n=1 Tax=Maribacter sp. 2307ULW6-5 TaxID=3386275 RepID=UPI0039BC8FB6
MSMDHNYPNTPPRNPDALRPKGGLPKLKVCGMLHNTAQVAGLRPDYLGFIFWEGSQRNFKGQMPPVPHTVKKVGVFVNAPQETVTRTTAMHGLLLVQLHGNETPEMCRSLQMAMPHVQLIKAFPIKDQFNFHQLEAYEEVVHFFLFDAKGKLPGGNGYTFNWKVLEKYPSQKPYFLSGGIGLEQQGQIKEFLKRPEAKYCHAIDVNSKFETAPGEKNVTRLTQFMVGMGWQEGTATREGPM